MPVAARVAAGELRHRITLVQPGGTTSATGGVTPGAGTTFAENVPAAISSSLGREVLQASQLNASVSHVIRMRYMAGVTPAMTVTFEDRTLQILSVLDVDERHVELQLLCAETQ